jgi:hypothetical protein
MIKALIRDYGDHHQDPSFIEDLFSGNNSEQLALAIRELLQEQDSEVIGITLFFVRDLVLTPGRDKHDTPFRVIVFETPILSTIEGLVNSPNYFVRGQAIYTLGKIGSTQSIPKLYQLFQQTKETDPLLAPRIVSELWWLQSEKDWMIIQNLADATNYLTRWAACGVLSVYSEENNQQIVVKEVLELLRDDTNKYIRDEARYQLQELVYRRERGGLTKPERKTRRIVIRSAQPLFTFADINTWFENKMHEGKAVSYTVEELMYFVEVEAPILAEERRKYQQSRRSKQE